MNRRLFLVTLLLLCGCSAGPLEPMSAELLGKGASSLLEQRPSAYPVKVDDFEERMGRQRYEEALPKSTMYRSARYSFKDGRIDEITLRVRPQAHVDVFEALEKEYGPPVKEGNNILSWTVDGTRVASTQMDSGWVIWMVHIQEESP